MAETAAPPRPAAQLDHGAGSDNDVVRWTQQRAALLRACRFDRVDCESAADATGLPRARLPSSCACTVDELLDAAFFTGPIDQPS